MFLETGYLLTQDRLVPMQKMLLRKYLTFAAVLACVALAGVVGMNYLKDVRDKVVSEQEARKTAKN